MKTVIYKTKANNITLEALMELNVLRKREDIGKLLTKISEGKSLVEVFNSESIASAVQNRLIKEGLIDQSSSLTTLGNMKLKDPLLDDIQEGIFSFSYYTFNINNSSYSVPYNMNRKQVNKKAELTEHRLPDFISNNQIYIDNEKIDITFFKDVKHINENHKSFITSDDEIEVEFDLNNTAFRINDRYYLSGNELNQIVYNYIESQIKNTMYGEFDFGNKCLYINNIKNFTYDELNKGIKSEYEDKGIYIKDINLKIKDIDTAVSYAYYIAMNKIKSNEYYSFKDLDQMFQNEILSSGIIDESLYDKLSTFRYSSKEFSNNVSKEEFEEMEYKIRITEYLLNISYANNSFTNAKNYEMIVDVFSEHLNPKDVKTVNLVMGYPLVKNKTNNIIDFVTELQKHYNKINIIKKGNSQKEDKSIEKALTKSKVVIKENDKINASFHDRYIIFELENGKHVSYLVTCEIGQFFNLNTNERKGEIIEVQQKDLRKDKVDMITLIKEAK